MPIGLKELVSGFDSLSLTYPEDTVYSENDILSIILPKYMSNIVGINTIFKLYIKQKLL